LKEEEPMKEGGDQESKEEVQETEVEAHET